MKNVLFTNHLAFERKFTVKNFTEFTEKHPNLRLERSRKGKVTIKPYLKFGDSKKLTTTLFFLSQWWLQKKKIGVFFNSSLGIELPDSSISSPSCGWISEERLAKNPVENEDESFLKVAPDFIIEVKSQSDSLKKLKKKMSDTWIKNGIKLAWLIDPYKQKAYIYKEGESNSEEVKGFDDTFLDGEEILKGFRLPLEKFKIFNQKRS